MDKARTRYLIAYDVCDPRRLAKVCRYLTGYKVGGQKSVFEVWVTRAELDRIHNDLQAIVDAEEDRLHIFALDPRTAPRCFGRAATFTTNHFAIV